MTDVSHMFLLELSGALPPRLNFEDLVEEIARADIPYRRHYSEYQSGGWWTCSLLGRSTDATDGEVTDARGPVVTDVLEKLPITRKFLEDMGLRYMMARLARLDPGGALWEHKDYQDLRRVKRQRIHLPLDTNPGAFLVSGGRRFHMGLGSLQAFRPTIAHGACNAGNRPRLHLMLDVYEDDYLKKLLMHAPPLPSAPMAKLTAPALADAVKSLRMMLFDRRREAERTTRTGDLVRWEQAVLGLYFAFSVPEGELYRALEQVCRENDEPVRAGFWAARRQLTLGEGLHDA